jgi:hypothetical protein
LVQEGIPGDARAINVPEKILIGFQGVVATSDTAIIDQSEEVIDLAGHILRRLLFQRAKSSAPFPLFRWEKKRGSLERT